MNLNHRSITFGGPTLHPFSYYNIALNPLYLLTPRPYPHFAGCHLQPYMGTTKINPYGNINLWGEITILYNVGPPSDGTMVYKPHEYYSYRYHKP